jgi:flagellar secretion chaperone FliS
MPSPIAKAEEMKRRYLREAVITATPAARLNMLFDKMIFDLGQADSGFEQGDLKAVNDGLCRAQDILLALRGTLRTDVWDGANNLSQLYFALYKELLQANMQKNRAQAQRVLEVVQDLAGAWRLAAEREAGDRLAATASAAAVGA